jgi:hypothetical protein
MDARPLMPRYQIPLTDITYLKANPPNALLALSPLAISLSMINNIHRPSREKNQLDSIIRLTYHRCTR